MTLNLGAANPLQGLQVIPAGTLVTLVMKIRPGEIGIEKLCKRSVTEKGMSEALDTEFVVKGDNFDGRKIFARLILSGESEGHEKAAGISRSLLRAIFEAVNAIDPKDISPEADAKRNSATLVGFNGATFLCTLEVEPGGVNKETGGRYKDKNVIGQVLRVGDKGYKKLDQPPPAPIERSAPPSVAGVAPASGSPAVSPTAIAPPDWAR